MKTLPTQSCTRPPGTGFTALRAIGLHQHFAGLDAPRAVGRLVGPEEGLAIGQPLFGLADVAVEGFHGLGLEFGRDGW